MNSALYVGATGMKALSNGLNVVTNNLANVSTVGFKQQMVTYSDLMYQSQGNIGESWNSTDDSIVAMGQVGMGVQIDAIKTSFNQGAFETGIELTDLAINGKGFFQVTSAQGDTLYTRAGNFRFNETGTLTLPGGEMLNGYAINEDGTRGALGPIQIDKFDVVPGSGTTVLDLGFNLGNISDNTSSTTDPYFSMAQNYDPTAANSTTGASYSQPLLIYDAAGQKQELTIHFDSVSGNEPNSVMEFLVTSNDANETPLMTGTLTFDGGGEIIDMSAFTPTDATNTQDLSTWVPATLTGGTPQLSYNGQRISLNLGITAQNGWQNAPTSAADVGVDGTLLPSMGTSPLISSSATTAYSGSNTQLTNNQDGYGEGTLTYLDIDENGRIIGSYTNGQSKDLFEIPIARFTSEDGLYREGGNFFSATPEAGTMTLGEAGTENFGTIHANALEMSNVDMAREMVNMIITQRGFQANSKSVTTADLMLQKAMELKRN